MRGRGDGVEEPWRRSDALNEELGGELLVVELLFVVQLVDYLAFPIKDLDEQLLDCRHFCGSERLFHRYEGLLWCVEEREKAGGLEIQNLGEICETLKVGMGSSEMNQYGRSNQRSCYR